MRQSLPLPPLPSTRRPKLAGPLSRTGHPRPPCEWRGRRPVFPGCLRLGVLSAGSARAEEELRSPPTAAKGVRRREQNRQSSSALRGRRYRRANRPPARRRRRARSSRRRRRIDTGGARSRRVVAVRRPFPRRTRLQARGTAEPVQSGGATWLPRSKSAARVRPPLGVQRHRFWIKDAHSERCAHSVNATREFIQQRSDEKLLVALAGGATEQSVACCCCSVAVAIGRGLVVGYRDTVG